LTVLAAIGLAVATRISMVPSLLLGLLIGTALPHLVIGRMGKRRRAAFIALFPDAIDLIVRALRSGLPVSEAIVGAGMKFPIRSGPSCGW
jgi:tight adherence protein B